MKPLLELLVPNALLFNVQLFVYLFSQECLQIMKCYFWKPVEEDTEVQRGRKGLGERGMGAQQFLV